MNGRCTTRRVGITCVGIASILIAASSLAAAQSEPSPSSQPPVRLPAATRPATAPRPRMMTPPGKMTIDAANGAYKALLRNVVNSAGLVDYDKLGRGMMNGLMDGAVQAYAGVEPPADSNQKLAFWINAYNANILKYTTAARGKPGFVNVDQVPGFFDKQEITVAGEKLTFNQLQEKIASLGEPRAHAAIVRGAMSSPPLRAEPYFADIVNDELEEQCRRWINDPTRNGVDNSALSVSMIFEWHKDAFNAKPYGDRIGFIRTYAAPDGPIAKLLAANPSPEIRFKPFDWTLNSSAMTGGAPRPTSPGPANPGTNPPPQREAPSPGSAPPPPAEKPAPPPGGSTP